MLPRRVKSVNQPPWHQSQSGYPSNQATYLQKLTHLRENLLDEDDKHFSQCLSRLLLGLEGQKDTSSAGTSMPNFTHESAPEKHKRLMMERQKQINSMRKNSPPKLACIKGKCLVKQRNVHKDQHRCSISTWDDLTALVEAQTKRLHANNPALEYHQSIPNVGRRAHTKHCMDMLTDSSEANNQSTFIFQKELHKKDSRGLYHGKKRRHLMSADKDEVDLTPESFKFVIPGTSEFQVRRGRQLHYFPPVSPLIRFEKSDSTANYGQSTQHQIIHLSRNNSKVMLFQNQSIEESSQVHLSLPVQQEILKQHRRHLTHCKQSSRLNCLFCQNPSISMRSIGANRYIMAYGGKHPILDPLLCNKDAKLPGTPSVNEPLTSEAESIPCRAVSTDLTMIKSNEEEVGHNHRSKIDVTVEMPSLTLNPV